MGITKLCEELGEFTDAWSEAITARILKMQRERAQEGP